MPVERELRELMACPNCRSPMDYREAEEIFVCLGCGYRYRVRDDIPVMLIEEAEKPGGG